MAVPWRERITAAQGARIEAAAREADLTPRKLEWLMGDPGAGGGMAPIGLLGREGGVEAVVAIVRRGWVGQVADGHDRALIRRNLALSPEARIEAMVTRHATLARFRGAVRR